MRTVFARGRVMGGGAACRGRAYDLQRAGWCAHTALGVRRRCWPVDIW